MGGPGRDISAIKGEFTFFDSTQFWLDSLKQDTFFINQYEKPIFFNKVGLGSNVAKQRVGPSYYGEGNGCDEADYISEYCTYAIQEVLFKSSTESVKIVRTKFGSDLDLLYNNPELKDKTRDALLVAVNNYSFSIDPKDTWYRTRYHFFDTITLGGKFYSNVIYTYRDTTGLSHVMTPTHPYGVYYIIPKGLIGFEYINGEKYFAK